MITTSKKISEHFHSNEFKCKCGCGKIKVQKDLVKKLEKLFDKLNASKCILSSGYRCSKHDKAVGGNGKGQHTKGKAVDCVFYDKKGKVIPSKIVICVANDLKQLRGMAKINNNYTHLDNRTGYKYRGDETVSLNSVWTDPYKYFKVSKSDVAKYTGEKAVKYLSNKSYKGSSITEALKQINVDSSYSYRSKLAKANGIKDYKGTASQNTKMLKLLKKGALIAA